MTPSNLTFQDDDSEPPYETIPSVPPNINIIANIEAVENFVSSTTTAAVEKNQDHGSREFLAVNNNFNSITSNTADSVISSTLPHDDSVISAHVDTGIYHLNKSRSIDSNPAPPISGSTSSIPNLQHHGNNVELLRKKLLMQDANETRL